MANQIETRARNEGVENVKQRPAVVPNVDVYENEAEILLLIDMPGVAKEDLRIDLDKDQITIEGRRTSKHQHAPQFSEFRAVDFRRLFSMPAGIDREKVDAELRSGILRVRLPKSDSLRPRQIPVRSS